MHSIGCFEDDGAAASASWHWQINNSSSAWMRRYNPTGTLQDEFYLNSFLSNGFRITYNANTSLAHIYNYLVVWGTDWTVNSGSYQAPTTAGISTVAHGLGAAPGFVMQMTGRSATNDDNQNDGTLSIGMASSTTLANQRCMNITIENGRTTMDTGRYMPVDKALGIVSETVTTTIDAIATITTMDATNIQVDWSDPSSIASRISWLAISGGKHDVHGMTAPASVGNQSKTGLSFQPEGLFAFSRGATATTTADAHAMISVGAAKSSSLHRSSLYTSEDATANCEALVRSSSAYVIETSPTAVAATASSTAAPNMQIELVQFNSDGYTVNYDATVSGFVWAGWAFGPTGSTAFNRTVNEAVTVSDSISRNITVNRPVTESVAVSEAMKRGVGRTVAESVTVAEASITRQLAANRTAAETVNIEEVVDRSGSFDRQVTDTPVNVSENIFRNVTLTLPAVTESVTVSEQITGQVGYNRTVNETVTVLGQNEFGMQEFGLLEFGSPGYETVSTMSGKGASMTESVTVSESITSNFGSTRAISEQIVNVSESISRQAAFQRTVNESVAVSELVSGGNNTNYFRVVDETVTISESITGVKPAIRGTARSIETSNRTGTVESRGGNAGNIET